MADSPLFQAAKAGDTETVRRRLDLGDDINARQDNEHALTWAAYKGRTEVVRLLIERGADQTVTDCNGRTPLQLAQREGHADVEQLLMIAVQQTTESWIRMGAATVAEVGSYPQLGRKLTHIFNFKTRERLTIAENLLTRAETITPPTCFDDLPLAAVEEAFAAFTRLGGVAERDTAVHGVATLGKSMKKLAPERNHGS